MVARPGQAIIVAGQQRQHDRQHEHKAAPRHRLLPSPVAGRLLNDMSTLPELTIG